MLALIPACSGGGRSGARPPATAPGPNPDVIPAVITPAYVDAVFKVLNHIYGNAVREEASRHRVDAIVQHDLAAIYMPPQLGVEISIFQQALIGSISDVLPDPGDRVFTTTELQRSGADCIQAVAQADYTAVDRTPSQSAQSLVLVLARRANRPASANPTPWAITYEKTEAPAMTCPT